MGDIMAMEKNFENRVKAFLKDEGAWFLKYWGGASYTRSGIPDLLVCFCGLFLGIELKAPGGRPSDLQIYHLRKIDQSGGYGILLYPEDYVLFQNFIHCIRAGDMENAGYNYRLLKSKWEHFENKMLKKGELTK